MFKKAFGPRRLRHVQSPSPSWDMGIVVFCQLGLISIHQSQNSPLKASTLGIQGRWFSDETVHLSMAV
jgi:hypothetical protein